jgi:hypothetical protein
MIVFLATAALAYETDQLTWRDRQLLDSTDVADALVDELLVEALERTNRRTGCEGTDSEVRGVLARQVHHVLGRDALVWERGLFRAPGFDYYSALLEVHPEVDKFAFRKRQDLFGDLSAWQSLILHVAGPCSTFEIAGRRIGSDKLDHFLSEGFNYYVRSRDGTDPERAIAWGTATERSIFGLLTSKTFSYGDLAANEAGYRFYAELLSERSVLQRDDDGCVEQVAPWRWNDWVSDAWDEVLNPSVFTREVERGVIDHLEKDRDQYCSSWARWDPAGELTEYLDGLDPEPPYIAGPAPARRDVLRLDLLCAEDPPDLDPHPLRPRVELRSQRRRSRQNAEED